MRYFCIGFAGSALYVLNQVYEKEKVNILLKQKNLQSN